MNWAEVGSLFGELAERNPDDRIHELEKIRAQNPPLADELYSLLCAHDLADGFFEEKANRVFMSIAHGLARLGRGPELHPGDRLLHFEILKMLGEGSLAKVYLARDTELDRDIALKITLSLNKEARTLARFARDGIVQVYSEHVVERAGQFLRIICLQYVAGPTLSQLQNEMNSAGKAKSLVQCLDGFSFQAVALEPAGLKWRETLSSLNLQEGAVLLGMRLAEILGHAHASGVLHLDIKPANILIDPFGRPFLSDFNVSTQSERLALGDLTGMGGTPYYMAPEQTRLFARSEIPATIDSRTDIFALGIVLRDLVEKSGLSSQSLNEILARATAADQAQRTPGAAQLAAELGSWLRFKMVMREMPRLGRGFAWIVEYPLLALVTLTTSSQVLATMINITYNRLQIVAQLTPEQNRIFIHCVVVYNLVTYPLLILWAGYAVRALFQESRSMQEIRECVVRIPRLLILMITIGWLPGAWVFPKVIDYFSGPVSPAIYWQFAGSFGLAWLISLTTTLAVVIFVLVRALYPKFWEGQSELAAMELRACERLSHSLVFAAALVPMFGMLMAVSMAPLEYSLAEGRSFKIFLQVIVGLGLINILFINRLTKISDLVFAALHRARPFE